MGVSERERSGWKFESPPELVHPVDPASMLEGACSVSSSGSGGAPGSPGLGRLEEVVEEAMWTLTSPTAETLLFCKDWTLSAPASSEPEGLCSPSGW